MRFLSAAVVSLALFVVAGSSIAGERRAEAPRHHVAALAALFQDNPFLGGQVAPRMYRWVNRDVSMFVQFDRPRPPDAHALRYIGIGLKGTFCAESQPGGANAGFTHYHRVTAPLYAQGHGGPAGTNTGYWLLWVAVDQFDTTGGRVVPGVDYAFSPTPPPTCGADPPRAEFDAPGSRSLTRTDIRQLAAFFHDNPFRGGQAPPRFYRWVNGDVLIWLQFDNANLAKAKSLRYVGIAKRGTFCKADQGHSDFTYFHRLTAKTYAKGRGGKAGERGFWHLAVAVNTARVRGVQVSPGVDRRFLRTSAGDCPKAPNLPGR